MGLQKNRIGKKSTIRELLSEPSSVTHRRNIRRTREASQRSEPSKSKTTATNQIIAPVKTKAEDIITGPKDTATTLSEPIPTPKTMADINDAAWPKADPALTQELLDLVQQCSHYRQLKKGANETTKSLSRGTSELCILAADTTPLSIVLHIPLLCEDKNTPYIYVPSKLALGRATGVSRPVISVSITSNQGSDLSGKIQAIREKVERVAM